MFPSGPGHEMGLVHIFHQKNVAVPLFSTKIFPSFTKRKKKQLHPTQTSPETAHFTSFAGDLFRDFLKKAGDVERQQLASSANKIYQFLSESQPYTIVASTSSAWIDLRKVNLKPHDGNLRHLCPPFPSISPSRKFCKARTRPPLERQ